MSDIVAKQSDIEGIGVFANRPFTPGEVVLVIDTSRVVDEDRPLRPDLGESENHCAYLQHGRVVLLDAPERHLNHSCDPNSYLKTIGGELRVVARRSIRVGEEITLDYVINTDGGSRWGCTCGADRCRGLLEASFFDLPRELKREYMPFIEDWFAEEHAEEMRRLREEPGEG